MQRNKDFMYSEDLSAEILALYGKGMSHVAVAAHLGLTKQQFGSTRALNIQFDDLCDFGEAIAQAYLEDMALAGAHGHIKNFNNTILQFLLKSQYPETYKDKKEEKEEGDSLLEQLAAGSLKLVKQNE